MIRRVVLRTRDATRLAAFYQELLGLLPHAVPTDRRAVALVHPLTNHELMTLIEGPDASLPTPQAPGLFHTAFLFPGLDDWRAAVNRALALAGGRCGASDHGVSWAVYLMDSDGNGIELAWDKPPGEWTWRGDRIQMTTRPLPLRGILLDHPCKAAQEAAFGIGHLHLQVADLGLADIYQEKLGLRVTQADYPGALFMARPGYHHHLAINTWHTTPHTVRPGNATGLVGWDMTQPDEPLPSPWHDPCGHSVALLD